MAAHAILSSHKTVGSGSRGSGDVIAVSAGPALASEAGQDHVMESIEGFVLV